MPAPLQTTAATTSSAAKWPARIARSVPGGMWVFADQGVVSLANFAAPVLVGRYAGQEQLGFFVLGFSIFLFVLGLARAMVWTAYTRRYPQLDAAHQPTYAGSATVHLLVFCLAAVLVTFGVATSAWLLGYGRYAFVLAVVGPCAAAMLVREHVRRLGLARLDFFEVFAFDLVVSAAQVSLLVWLASQCRISAAWAFVSLATTSLLAVPWLLYRRDMLRFDRNALLPDWLESWSITKWLTGGAAAVLLGKEGYNWLLSAITTIAELGRLGAARVVIQVTNPLVIGGSNYLGPISAKVLAEEGVTGLWRFTVRTSLVMLAAILAFLLCVAALGVPVVEGLFEKASAGVTTTLLVTLTAGVLSEALLIPIEYASVNLGKGKLMFQTAVTRLLVNGSLGFALVGLYGAEAIGVGMLLGSLVALVWQWVAFAREVRRA